MKQPIKAPIYENHPFVFAFRANGGDSYKIDDITDSAGHRTGYAIEVTPGMPLPNLKEYLVKSATLQSVLNSQLAIIAIPYDTLKPEYQPVLAPTAAPAPPSSIARRLLKHLKR